MGAFPFDQTRHWVPVLDVPLCSGGPPGGSLLILSTRRKTMRIKKVETVFEPVIIYLETKTEFDDFWGMIDEAKKYPSLHNRMATEILNLLQHISS
jgi:hypothetical protein